MFLIGKSYPYSFKQTCETLWDIVRLYLTDRAFAALECEPLWTPEAKVGKNYIRTYQWKFQDPKIEVLYHIRPYFVGIFPSIGLKNRPYIWLPRINRFLLHGHWTYSNPALGGVHPNKKMSDAASSNVKRSFGVPERDCTWGVKSDKYSICENWSSIYNSYAIVHHGGLIVIHMC